MLSISYTLITDGSSDKCLMPIINWVIKTKLAEIEYSLEAQWAELRNLPKPPKHLHDKIAKAIDIFPCDIVFIHRDAESQDFALREQEIKQAIDQSDIQIPFVCIVPIKMQEAWLLIEEEAIRAAAANPNGSIKLKLPSISELETITHPKDILHNLLKQASDLSGRRLDKFLYHKAAIYVSETIVDFSILRNLSGFRRFEESLHEVLDNMLVL
jgi:hypothetical protein